MSLTKLSEIYITKMVKNDIEQVAKLAEQAYGEHHWSKASFYDELSNNLAYYFCAKNKNNELLGYIGYWQIIDEAHITTVAVKKEYQRNSIGEALVTSVIDTCLKSMVKYLTLEVRISNEPAINLYKKYGFQSLGVRKCYYQDNNEDALIMWTENIFYDKFKKGYNDNKEILTKKINIIYE